MPQLPQPGSQYVVSPRTNANNPRDNGAISGIDMISLNRDTSLHFSFPQIGVQTALPGNLVVRHANAIKWSYVLNTNVIPTYAGEVIQVLSAYTGPITITGQSQDYFNSTGDFISANDELRRIYDWFRAYMTIAAGAGRSVIRNETAIHFTYPERGWSFYIQPTALNGFAYGTTRLGTEWSIQAEVVMDNDLNYFEAATMAQFTDVPMTAVFDDPTFTGSLFHGAGDPRIDPLAAPNQGLTSSKLADFGNNFQDLVAAYTSGDYAHWGFDANVSPSENNLQDAASVYSNLFGTSNLVSGGASTTGSTGSGAVTYGGPPNPTSQTDIANLIYASFQAAGIPGRLGIAVSLQESGLNPNDVQQTTNPAGGIGLFQVNGDGTGRVNSSEVKQAGANRFTAKITDSYPVSDQVADAVKWFTNQKNSTQPGGRTGTIWAGVNLMTASDETLANFAWDAQGAAAGYVTAIEKQLGTADQIIKGFNTSSSGDFTNPFPHGWVPNRLDMGYDGTFAYQIVAPFSGTIIYAGLFNGWKGSYGVIIKSDKTIGPGVPTDCLYFTEGVYPLVSSGDKVSKGDPICKAYPSPYGDAYGTTSDGSGQIEWGVANSGPVGNQTDTYAITLGTGSAQAKQMVLNFANWAQSALGIAAPSQTSSAGAP